MHMDITSMAFFFGFIGLSFFILILISVIANKYLRGDYIKVNGEEEYDEVEESSDDLEKPLEEAGGGATILVDLEAGTVKDEPKKKPKGILKKKGKKQKGNTTETLDTLAEETPKLTDDTAENNLGESEPEIDQNKSTKKKKSFLSKKDSKNKGSTATLLEAAEAFSGSTLEVSEGTGDPLEAGYDGEFAVNAIINISMSHLKKEKTITGAINGIRDLGTGPAYIRFHLKLLPLRKPHVKTNWGAAQKDTYAFLFSLNYAKIKPPPDAQSSLCIRLYGKKKKKGTSRAKCYAECIIPWEDISDDGEPLNLARQMHRKGGDEYLSSSTDDLLSD